LQNDRLALRHRAATGVPGSDVWFGRWSSDGHAGLPRSDVLHTQHHDSRYWLVAAGDAGEHGQHPNRGEPPTRCWWSGLRDHHDGKGGQHQTDGDHRRLPLQYLHATAHLGSDRRPVSRNVCASVGRAAHRHRECQSCPRPAGGPRHAGEETAPGWRWSCDHHPRCGSDFGGESGFPRDSHEQCPRDDSRVRGQWQTRR